MALKGIVKIDDRGRFLLPTDIFREVNAMAEGKYVVNRSTDRCVTLYPSNVWKIVESKLNKINVFDPKKRALVRYFLGSAVEIEVDKKNRLLVPQDLREYAGIDKEMQIIKLNPFMELWNPEWYNKQMETTGSLSAEDISLIAEEIYKDGSEFDLP